MPNHIQNRLKIVGTKEDILTVKSFLSAKGEDGSTIAIDFNNIKRMPEGLDISIHSGIETAVNVALKMPTHSNRLIESLELANRQSFKSPLEFTDGDWLLYIQALNNVRKHGFIYWYDWSIKNWGTKWNAYGQPDSRDTENTIHFETAWSAPIDLMVLLSENFPAVTFEFDYADEDGGCNTGRLTIKAGQILKCVQPENSSMEGYEIYFELHPDSRQNYKLLNGKYEYVEDDE